jgi:Glyoxalase-like domain
MPSPVAESTLLLLRAAMIARTCPPGVANARRSSREFVTLLTLALTCAFASDCRSGKLVAVEEGKTAKNRIHFDLWPTSAKRDEHVQRAIDLGAVVLDDRRRADGAGWVVFADHEGNEFCIGRSAAERAAGAHYYESSGEGQATARRRRPC